MSIKCLLTKMVNTKARKKASDIADDNGELSNDVGGPQPIERHREKEGSEKGDQVGDAHVLAPMAYRRHSKIHLRCDCSYEGTGTRNKSDLVFAGKGRNEYAYFECPKCKRTLRYDCLTG